MNSYPSWWNTTITIFNKYEDTSTREVTWYCTVIPGCFWKNTNNRISIDTTILESNNIKVRIPKMSNFCENYLWNNLSADDKASHFTLSVGDIIARGDQSAYTIDEYTSGSRSSDVLATLKKSQGALVVETYAVNTDGGRVNEHYYVTGI